MTSELAEARSQGADPDALEHLPFFRGQSLLVLGLAAATSALLGRHLQSSLRHSMMNTQFHSTNHSNRVSTDQREPGTAFQKATPAELANLNTLQSDCIPR